MAFFITDPCIGTKDTACVDVCPVSAIYAETDVPSSQLILVKANQVYRVKDAEARAQAEKLVSHHIDTHPELMEIVASERALKH